MHSNKLYQYVKGIKATTILSKLKRTSRKNQLLTFSLFYLLLLVLFDVVSRLWYPHSPTIMDHLFLLTESLNHFLRNSAHYGNLSLILLGLMTDFMTFTMIGLFLHKPSHRLVIMVSIFFIVRRLMNYLCILPVPATQLYHYPGFPTLTTQYGMNNDFFYSGHAGFGTLVVLEIFKRYQNLFVRIFYVTLLILISTLLIVDRIHYTMDIYAGIVTAVALYLSINKILCPPNKSTAS